MSREAELAQLHHWLDKALSGERQLVFVTGEAGIGKTTLIDAFLLGIRDGELGVGEQKRQKAKGKIPNSQPQFRTPNTQHPTPSLGIGRGQCVEHYGASEPYLPIFEALGRLSRGPDREQLITVLRQYAPTWLVHLPALLSPIEREQLQRQV